MSQRILRLLRVAALLSLVTVPAPAAFAERVLLLVDTSGSMRGTDPEGRIPALLDGFVERLPADSHVAVVAFDGETRLLRPLTEAGRWPSEALAALAYDGARTDPARAVERALYELRQPDAPGRGPDALVLITDGVVDLGAPDASLRAEDWLLGDLRAALEAQAVAVYAVALTEAADFRILSQLTTATGGDYFRALDTAAATEALGRIGEALLARRQAAFVPRVTVSTPAPNRPATNAASIADASRAPARPPSGAGTPAAAPEPSSGAAPGTSEAAATPARAPWRGIAALLLLAGGATLLAVVTFGLLRRRPPRIAPATETLAPDYVPECHLLDLSGATDAAVQPLRTRRTVVTRLADPPEEPGTAYLCIPRKQIGRRHATLEYRDYAFWVVDQNSVNGTFVNGERVTGERRLKHGDRLRFHDREFEFRIDDLSEAGETVLGATTTGASTA
ncbi:MAG: FHA domain-containing protein [Pseudomonadales bacterium]|jgi:uncharacterized protein YegL|nr:FHA domain-containing protein [Pseudomonadales bacterium]